MKRQLIIGLSLPCLLLACSPEVLESAEAREVAPASRSGPVPEGGALPVTSRSVAIRLFDAIKADTVTPRPVKHPAMKCLKKGEPAVGSPFSKLPRKLRRMHRRATLNVENRLRFEMHDSLAFFPPRKFRFDVRLPKEPQLEFFHAVDPCRYGTDGVRVRIRLSARGRVLFERSLDLRGQSNRLAVTPWTEVRVPLPFVGDEEVEVEVEFERKKKDETLPILWAEPLISGREIPAGGARDHNVLLVVVDAMRADTVGPTRKFEELAPTMNALFEEGTSFSRAYSVSNQTRHSTLGLLTGQPPTLGGFYSSTWVTQKALRTSFYGRSPPLLPRLLSRKGFYVSAISHNRFQFASHPFGLDHGFDHVYDDRQKVGETAHLADRAIEHLRRHRDDRFFLMLNLVAPHLPYQPPDEHLERVNALYGERVKDETFRRYLAEVAYVDTELRRVFSAMSELGLRENTLIVLTSDHGEVFHQAHHCWSKRYKQSCHYNHGMTLFEEEVHVPMVFVLPREIEAKRVIETPTSHLDLAPTILDFLGLAPEPRHVGLSFSSLLRGDERPAEPVYIESRTGTALVDGHMKFHTHSVKDDTRTIARMGGRNRLFDTLPRYQLFDLLQDPEETRNLALEDPEVVTVWRQKLTETRRLLARRLGSVEELRASGGRVAVNKLRLVSDGTEHELVGRLHAKPGKLTCVQTRGDATCSPIDANTIEVSLRSGRHHPELAFTSTPRSATLLAELELDGEHHAIDRLRLGPFGLRLLRNGELLDRPNHLRFLTGRHGPKVRAKDDLAVYMWRNPAGPASKSKSAIARTGLLVLGPDELDSQEVKEDLSPELQGILKDLGYTQ